MLRSDAWEGSLVFRFWNVLTAFGIAYLVGEVAIISVLVGVEWRVAASRDTTQQAVQ